MKFSDLEDSGRWLPKIEHGAVQLQQLQLHAYLQPYGYRVQSAECRVTVRYGSLPFSPQSPFVASVQRPKLIGPDLVCLWTGPQPRCSGGVRQARRSGPWGMPTRRVVPPTKVQDQVGANRSIRNRHGSQPHRLELKLKLKTNLNRIFFFPTRSQSV